MCDVKLLLFSVTIGFCSSGAFSASSVFCVGLCFWVGSLPVHFGFLLAVIPLPPHVQNHPTQMIGAVGASSRV
jgi:hypothetical protein